jgi:molybdopterin-containing oxidoreductase family iron-sulfur binding subunit
MHWLRLDRYFNGDPEGDAQVVMQPLPVHAVRERPLRAGLPVAATVHDSEGLNVMVYNRCIGTRYCSNNCPYKVRHFNFYNLHKDTPEDRHAGAEPGRDGARRGVMEKCTYCTQRINSAKDRRQGRGQAAPGRRHQDRCQQSCPADAITSATCAIRKAGGEVSRIPRNYRSWPSCTRGPRTTYLAKLRNPHPDLAGLRSTDDGRFSPRARVARPPLCAVAWRSRRRCCAA